MRYSAQATSGLSRYLKKKENYIMSQCLCGFTATDKDKKGKKGDKISFEIEMIDNVIFYTSSRKLSFDEEFYYTNRWVKKQFLTYWPGLEDDDVEGIKYNGLEEDEDYFDDEDGLLSLQEYIKLEKKLERREKQKLQKKQKLQN